MVLEFLKVARVRKVGKYESKNLGVFLKYFGGA